MELVLIGFAVLLTSVLTLLSGFGLGMALIPVFALFLPFAARYCGHRRGALRQQSF